MSTPHGIPKGSLWGFHLRHFRSFWCSSPWTSRWSGQLPTTWVRQVMRRLILWGPVFISPLTPALLPSPILLRSRLTSRPALNASSVQVLTHPALRSSYWGCRSGLGCLLLPVQPIGALLTSSFSAHTGSDFLFPRRMQHRQRLYAPRPHSLGFWLLDSDASHLQGGERDLSCGEPGSQKA